LAKQIGKEVHDETPDALNPLLSSLTEVMPGFYEVASKARNRLQKNFSPCSKHARIIVSLTFAFCEYLLKSKQKRST
jgi:hypothetical protein